MWQAATILDNTEEEASGTQKGKVTSPKFHSQLFIRLGLEPMSPDLFFSALSIWNP